MFTKTENSLKYSIIILGFTTLVTQIILLREFLTVFYGNELVIGIILANWMLLTAGGTFIGKYFDRVGEKMKIVVPSQILLGILPIIVVFLIYYLKNLVLPVGKMVSLTEIFIGSLILLLPFCFISGVLFTIFCSWLSSLQNTNIINKVYAWEAFGSIAGGLVFNFIFIFYLKTFFSLTILMMLNLFAAGFILFTYNKKTASYILSAITILLTILLMTNNIDRKALNFLYENQEVIFYKDTPYGNIVVTKTDDQFNFFENGVSVFSSDNIISNEENVHYAMVQHAKPENVLLISGGVAGTLNEILKYNIKSLDYVEINPTLIEIGEMLTGNLKDDERIHIINQDARIYLAKTEKSYDVVLINLPDPSNVQLNRYYTLEFFEKLKEKLNSKAVISISLQSTKNYVSKEAGQIHATLFSTLKLVFKNVIIIPGERNYFLSSDDNLSYAISSLIISKVIETEYVNKFYIDDYRIAEESRLIEDAISNHEKINYDFKPLIYFLQLKYWLSYFGHSYYLLGLIIFIPFLIIIFRLNIINFGLFVTGFSASSIEIVLIIAFQVIYGYVYQMMGIIITFFMAGLGIGSYYLIKKISINHKVFSIIQYLIGIISILIPLILLGLQNYISSSFVIHLTFIILIMIIGILTGVQFSLATKLRVSYISTIAATAYSSDLLGSAVGALLSTAFLIPYLGLIKVLLLVGIINIIAGLIILLKTKNR